MTPPNREYPFKDIPDLYNLINKFLLKSCKCMMKFIEFSVVRSNFNILEWDTSLARVADIIIGNQPVKLQRYYL